MAVTVSSIVLFTRDLRVHDHPALAAAAAGPVVPLFVFDDDLLRRRGASNRVAFLLDSLADLRRSLQGLGADLVVRRGDPAAEVARLASEVGAGAVHLSADVSGWAHRREATLAAAAGATGAVVVAHPGVTVVGPGALTPAGGDHYRVFTPYWRRWRSEPWREVLAPPRLEPVAGVPPGPMPALDELVAGLADGDRYPPPSPGRATGGETAGRRRVDEWFAAVTAGYEAHDDLAGDGTSRLSPYLRFGCVSPTEVAQRAAAAGAEAWLRQLCWRDFLHQVTDAFGAVTRREYRSRGIPWAGEGPAVDAWRAGRTGVPIVDAGMRQLRHEGWMHNRARLITASFLVKHLGVDWRLGAEHFWRWLVDGDVANNYGGWQWVAGTGNDTRPNRVLNPIRQAQRFDPEGRYVRRWVPELAAVDGALVHEPWRLPAARRAELDYPDPIVDPADPAWPRLRPR